MEAGVTTLRTSGDPGAASGWGASSASHESATNSGIGGMLEAWMDRVAPCPWGAHAGLSPWGVQYGSAAYVGDSTQASGLKSASKTGSSMLYTPEERARRDASPWTLVQGVLAPLQFLVCAASLVLIVRYLTTGQGYALATASILLKTVALYGIMLTGSIWEKDVFGKWLFAPAFFWEDAISMVVIALQTTYVFALVTHWGTPAQQMLIAVAAYVAYAVNATQFLLKLRAARLEAAPRAGPRASAAAA